VITAAGGAGRGWAGAAELEAGAATGSASGQPGLPAHVVV